MNRTQACEHIVVPGGNVCGKPAACIVTFLDGQRVSVCEACAVDLAHLAENHGAPIHVVRRVLE